MAAWSARDRRRSPRTSWTISHRRFRLSSRRARGATSSSSRSTAGTVP